MMLSVAWWGGNCPEKGLSMATKQAWGKIGRILFVLVVVVVLWVLFGSFLGINGVSMLFAKTIGAGMGGVIVLLV